MTNKDNIIKDIIEPICENNYLQLKKLLESGANPNAIIDYARVTPLHFAAQHNSVECAHLLIKYGANPHAQTHPDGETPLDAAILHENHDIIDLLKTML